MSSTQIATELLRAQFAGAHSWLESTLAGVTDEVAAWQPQGRANPIGAHYVHHITAEDFFIHSLLQGGTPLMASSYAGRTGMSAPPPMGDWGAWAREVVVDMSAARQYAQAVYAATDSYLEALHDDDLAGVLDLTSIGLGSMPLGSFLSTVLANCSNHSGEIACLKGLQGLQGYPM